MHSHGDADHHDLPPVSRRARVLLGCVVFPLLVLTAVGAFVLRPDPTARPASIDLGAEGVTFPTGQVTSLHRFPCPAADDFGEVGGASADAGSGAEAPPARPRTTCGTATVRVTSGPDAGTSVTVDVPPEVVAAGARTGVELLRTPEQEGSPATYSLYDLQRGRPLVAIGVVFALLVVAVAGLRGLRALVGLGFAAVVIVEFTLPALLSGRPALAVGLVSAAAIMLVVLYLAHGVSARTTTALLGTFAGLGLTAFAGWYAVRAAHLTGVSSDDNSQLQVVASQLDLRALLTCGIVLAGLGVLNDVTITQSSAVWELQAAAPRMRPAQLYAGAMRIGRDHIASTVYTIVFAYAGAALPVLLLIDLYAQPLTTVLTNADVAEELVRTAASAIGLVLAVPVTTAVAVLVAVSGGRPRPGGRRRSHDPGSRTTDVDGADVATASGDETWHDEAPRRRHG